MKQHRGIRAGIWQRWHAKSLEYTTVQPPGGSGVADTILDFIIVYRKSGWPETAIDPLAWFRQNPASLAMGWRAI